VLIEEIRMRLVDAHAHLGSCRVFDLNVVEDELIKAMDGNKVDAAVVQPFPGAPNPVEVHNRIAALAEQYPGRIFGIASLNPHMGKTEYIAEVERCVKDLGFVGLKLHTVGHAVNPLSEDGETVFSTAERLGVPIMVHTGPGIPFALPSLCIRKAKQHPHLPVILAHAGFGILAAEAFEAAKECGNIILETSWVSGLDVKWFVDAFSADRVMMGSDLPKNLPNEIGKHYTIGLNEVQLAKCLGETAVKVFKLRI